jgi:hypothetical protein
MNSSPRYRIRLRRSEKVRTASVADTCVVIKSDYHTFDDVRDSRWLRWHERTDLDPAMQAFRDVITRAAPCQRATRRP